jgi:hypothetical protein
MIITKEKYKGSYIIYIDETTHYLTNDILPASFERSRTSLGRRDYALRRQRLGERRVDLL